MKPEILILDEPTAGLDPKAHYEILEMIEAIHENEGTTIILVSHNMGDIARLCDKVLVMDKGTLRLMDTPDRVFSQVEMLESLGLGLPPATEIMRGLQKGGLRVPTNVLTTEEAEEVLCKFILDDKLNEGEAL
jgi:energy-coupling factor transport system ATP-binding protein